MTIHRANLNARPVCGIAGRVKLSTSGVGVTCPECIGPDAAKMRELDAAYRARFHAGTTPKPPTVKRASLWDGVTDTYRTEAEHNGFRPTQGALL